MRSDGELVMIYLWKVWRY